MSHAHPTGWLLPQTPMPVITRYPSIAKRMSVSPPVIASAIYHWTGTLRLKPSTICATSFVTSCSEGLPSTSTGATCGSLITARSATVFLHGVCRLQFRIRITQLCQVSGTRFRVQFREHSVVARRQLHLGHLAFRIIHVSEYDALSRARLSTSGYNL